jgi:CubicO group peptidase (beta-lactamase class C family)
MGITQFSWMLDRAGNPYGMAGLSILAKDFAKVGQMMLDGGNWRGSRIVGEDWVKLSTKPGQDQDLSSGLLWWRVVDKGLVVDDAFVLALKEYGPSDETIKAVELLKKTPMESTRFWPTVFGVLRKDKTVQKRLDEIDKLLRQNKGPVAKEVLGRDSGFMAWGYLGQYLVILPEARLVAVRQFRSPGNPHRDHDRGRPSKPSSKPFDPDAIDAFTDFPRLVRDLVPSKPRECD